MRRKFQNIFGYLWLVFWLGVKDTNIGNAPSRSWSKYSLLPRALSVIALRLEP